MARTALWIMDFESIFFRELRKDLGVSESFVALVLGKQPYTLVAMLESGITYFILIIWA